MALHMRELRLHNFRGAVELSLALHPRLNVFAGANGGGKSTVLDAAAIGLTVIVRKILAPSREGFGIAEEDIRNGANHAEVRTVLCANGRDMTCIVPRRRRGRERGGRMSVMPTRMSEEAFDFIEGLLRANDNGDANFPLFVYYPVKRAVVDIPLRIRGHNDFENIAAYQGALTAGAKFRAFRTFFQWFRDREDLENQRARDEKEHSDPQLQAVRDALGKFMREFGGWRVQRNPLRMEVQKDGKKLTVDQLSDGEKCLLALVGDLARRLATANPRLADPLQGEGVVLIDEADLHLHPEWQRRVAFELLRVFPNCQFLLSTHSPHVINHVREGEVFLLRQGEDGLSAAPACAPYGKTAERVEVDLMGVENVRPREVADTLRAIYSRIGKGETDQARGDIADLRGRIGDDPELTKAEVLIVRKQVIGK